MIDGFIKLLDVQCQKRIAALTDSIVKGSATDHADYKRMAGEIKGLKEALAIARDVYKKVMSDDESE